MRPTVSLRPPTLVAPGSSLGCYERITVEPPCGDTARARLLIVPGNPGQPAWYCTYAERLAELLNAEVTILGLAGHLSSDSTQKLSRSEANRLFNIDEQQQHVSNSAAEFVREAQQSRLPVALIGHSIGAWLALGATAALVEPSVRGTRSRSRASPARTRPPSPRPLPPPTVAARGGVAVLGLMPFLEQNMADERYAAKHRLLTQMPWLIRPVALFAWLLRRLPRWLRRRALAVSVPWLNPPRPARTLRQHAASDRRISRPPPHARLGRACASEGRGGHGRAVLVVPSRVLPGLLLRAQHAAHGSVRDGLARAAVRLRTRATGGASAAPPTRRPPPPPGHSLAVCGWHLLCAADTRPRVAGRSLPTPASSARCT